ncbi:MAG: phage minor head protein [Pseudomonadota bacterium]
MARKQTLSAFQRELRKIEPALAQAFAEAMQDVKSTAQREVIAAAIERRDIEAVIQALRLGREFFAPLDARIEQSFYQGAIWQMGQMPKKIGPEGVNLVARFDQRNPRAETWTRLRGSTLITEITGDQRTAIRQVIEAGIAAGEGEATIARRLIGTTQGNQRKGGLIGLHSRHAAAVTRARAELADPTTMGNYLTRKRRDKRYDGTVRKAMRESRPLNATQIAKITGRYSDRLLQTRGRGIARTEAHNAFNAGRYEAIEQMIESGQVPADAVKLIWQATPDTRVRDPHRSMNGQEVRYGVPFQSPTGALLRFPGDTQLGASGDDTINCRCGFRVDIDFVALAA